MKSMGLSYLISSDTFYHGPEQLYWVWVRKFSRAGIRRKYIIQKRNKIQRVREALWILGELIQQGGR